MALACGVTGSSVESPPAHVPVLVGQGLRVAVGADQAEIIEVIIERIAILVIEFQRRNASHPFGYAAHFAAMAPKVEEMTFQRACRNVFKIIFDSMSSFELKLTG